MRASAVALSFAGLLLALPLPAIEARTVELEPFPGTVYFTANDGQHEWELWASDGSQPGTHLVQEIHPGTGGRAPYALIGVDRTLHFRASDGRHGVELWLTDGTEAATQMVKDILPGEPSSFPVNLFQGIDAIGNVVYFTARDGVHGRALWRTDGT
ncbi:MAG: ELWxxDGT repeat protein [Actinomycetota bacterium]